MTTSLIPPRPGRAILALLLILFASSFSAWASPIMIDFDALPDSTPVTTQFSGFVFSNATVLSAGISLNEFEFPPRSGTNVVFDDGGPMSIQFSPLAIDFRGYFTYLTPIALQAFDPGNNVVASATSLFSSNLALSGDPGSLPNELLQVAYASGIARVTITGDALGSSFTLDDLSAQVIPEPVSALLVAAGCFLLAALKRRRVAP